RDQVAGGIHDGVHQRVVAEVGPAVVHVQDGDVHDAVVAGGKVRRLLHAAVEEDAALGDRGAVGDAEAFAVVALVAAEDGQAAQAYRSRFVSSTRRSTTARRSWVASQARICRSAPVSPVAAQVRRKVISGRVPSSSTSSSTKSRASGISARVGISRFSAKSIMLLSSPFFRARNLFSSITAREW